MEQFTGMKNFEHKKNITRIVSLVLCAAISVLFFGCRLNKTDSKTEFVLGTVCSIEIPKTKTSAALLEACFSELRRLEKVFSANDASSELSAVNKTAYKAPVVLSENLAALLTQALDIAHKTDKAFDPAIGAVVKLWNIGFDTARIPAQSEIDNVLPEAIVENIKLENSDAGTTVFFTSEKVKLDLGAVAKGYSADYIAALLKANGVKSAVINLGGNVLTIGKKFFTNDNWKIGLRNPSGSADSVKLILSISGKSVVTSGIYERYFEKNGVRYHHVLDPKTGYPVKNNLMSVSVVCESSTYADALATGFLVMGYEKSIAFLKQSEKMHGEKVDAVFFFDDGSWKSTNDSIILDMAK